MTCGNIGYAVRIYTVYHNSGPLIVRIASIRFKIVKFFFVYIMTGSVYTCDMQV